MPRLFVAVPLPVELKGRLAQVQQQLKTAGPALRLPRPESLHVTLAFLGDRPAESLEQLRAAVLSVGRSHGAFSCDCTGLGAFPTGRRARVLWAGFDNPLLWNDLHRGLVTALGEDVGRFHPHVTLARVRGRPCDVSALIQRRQRETWGRIRVDRVILYQSELRPGGAVHTPLVQSRLTGPAAG
ncbi:MAG: RNA 2',3'-cyclic phosphodiesterase [Deltaproteobacteria bacterium]|nr:MAG: RNA 2',3'-cyclic phosphodiesterase [Deltaproteobacteria bacterium]